MYQTKGISAINAFNYLKDSSFARLIDIRSPQQVFVAGYPDLGDCHKTIDWMPCDFSSVEHEDVQSVLIDKVKSIISSTKLSISDVVLLFICRRGHSSLEVAEVVSASMSDIVCYSVDGGFSGIKGWIDCGLPIYSFFNFNSVV